MSTFVAKSAEIQRKWYVVDAEGQTLGRLASEVAKVLRGKHKPEFTPFLDTGDYVIVINAPKMALTGNNLHQKLYPYPTLSPPIPLSRLDIRPLLLIFFFFFKQKTAYEIQV